MTSSGTNIYIHNWYHSPCVSSHHKNEGNVLYVTNVSQSPKNCVVHGGCSINTCEINEFFTGDSSREVYIERG